MPQWKKFKRIQNSVSEVSLWMYLLQIKNITAMNCLSNSVLILEQLLQL